MADKWDSPTEGFSAVSNLEYDGQEDALREIARLLRKGHTSPLFLSALADALDPDVPKPFYTPNTKLRPYRTRRGQPPRKPNWSLGMFLYVRIAGGEKYEAAVAEACERFGVNRDVCQKELKRLRENLDPFPADDE